MNRRRNPYIDDEAEVSEDEGLNLREESEANDRNKVGAYESSFIDDLSLDSFTKNDVELSCSNRKIIKFKSLRFKGFKRSLKEDNTKNNGASISESGAQLPIVSNKLDFCSSICCNPHFMRLKKFLSVLKKKRDPVESVEKLLPDAKNRIKRIFRKKYVIECPFVNLNSTVEKQMKIFCKKYQLSVLDQYLFYKKKSVDIGESVNFDFYENR